MSSKITKRMMSSVDDMVSRAEAATKRTDLGTSKRKAAKRALLGASSKRVGKASTGKALASKSGSISKKARKSGRPVIGLLEKARRELRGKSRAARNVSLLSYSRGEAQQRDQDDPQDGLSKTVDKSRKAIDHLLQLDDRTATRKRVTRKM